MRIDPLKLLRFMVCVFGCATASNVLLLAAEPVRPAAPAVGADPKVNREFDRPDVNVWTGRFEGESREVFAARDAIVRAAKVSPGMMIADVGAGTGLFTMLFAQQVAPAGRVIAIDISSIFLLAIAQRARAAHLDNVTTVLGSHTDINLAEASVDLVFTSDTYHHFENVAPLLASVRRALKPGGRMIVVDFERIPGVTGQRTLDHVRAGKETVMQEIVGAGFKLIEEVRSLGLRENYYLVFERS